ncbi:MAG: FG-GAP repeat domain-containing protein [Fimbriimonadaceae bacterium]
MWRASALFLAATMLSGVAQAQVNEPGVYLMNETFGNPNSGKILRMNLIDRQESAFNYSRDNLNPSVVAVGVGDFNEDGWADAVFTNFGDEIVIIYQVDGTFSGVLLVDVELQPGEKVVGVGQFDGTGPSDILVQNGASHLSAWIMGGIFGTERQSVVDLGSSMISGTDRFCGFADVTGDGLADVILNRSKKDLNYWLNTGGNVMRGGNGLPIRHFLLTLASKGRQQGYGKTNIMGSADLDMDGSPDLIARENKGADRYSVWVYTNDGTGLFPAAGQTHFRNTSNKKPIGVGLLFPPIP